MTERCDRPRVLVLVSGGPDGDLAARMLEDLGCDVGRVHLDTGFVRPDRSRAAAGSRRVDVRASFLREVVAPAVARGNQTLDACVACRGFLLRTAVDLARRDGFDAVATGEVVGQDPRSQSRAALRAIADASGAPDAVLRPLCARRLEPTRLERDGRVDRAALGNAHGRGRAFQRELARRLGVPPGPQPGGLGCLLDDPATARRVRDVLARADGDEVGPATIERLRLGRHFRVGHDAKAIVARNADESDRLRASAGGDGAWILAVSDAPGATVLLDGRGGPGPLARAAGLAVRYSAHRDRTGVAVTCRRGEETRVMKADPTPPDALRDWRV